MDVQSSKASVSCASLPYSWISSKLELYRSISATAPSLALLPTQPGISLLKMFSSLLSSNSYSLLIFWAPLSRVTGFAVKALPLSGWSLEAFRCLSQERKNSSPGARGDLSSLVSAWFLLGKAVGWRDFTEQIPRILLTAQAFVSLSLWCIAFDQNQS